jgi:REP element-mobilizing transposase RayT
MMNDKFHDRYRIPSARLKGWDYGRNGIYFITICTAGHQCYLGEITDGKMLLSEMGKVVYQNWKLIPSHFPFTELADFVVMPNHIHGIIIVDKMDDGYDAALPEKGNKFGPQSGNIPSIIRGFKASVKTYANLNHIWFEWQPRYHDHIIRNDESFLRISEYIIQNPCYWHNDQMYRPR